MADEYGLRRDVDELYDLVYDNESNQFKLVTKDDLEEFSLNIDLSHYSKSEVDELIEEIVSGQIDLTNYIKKSNTTGLVKNDGSIDTNTYVTSANIDGKEDKSNKVTSWSSTTTDTHYPSEKLVKTSLDDKISKSNTTGLVKNDGSVDTSAYVVQETGKGLFSGSYNDLTNKPTIPSAYTHPSTKQCNYSYTHPSEKQCTTSLTSEWVETTLNQYATLYVNETTRMCELRYIRSFSSASADTFYSWGTEIIPSGYRPSSQVQGSFNQVGVLYVDSSGNIGGKFAIGWSSSRNCIGSVMWHY